MAQANSITNPNNLIDVGLLNYFEGKMAAKYQTQAIAAITGLSAETVEGAIAELLGKIQALPSAIIPKGTRTFAQLAPATDLVAGSLGYMWNISDAFVTTADFAEGAGHSVPAGANVYVANVGTAQSPSYKYDVFNGMYDLSIFKTIDSLKSKGAANKGVYFDADGNAQAMTYEVNKTVPSDAVFTDTTYESLAASSGGTDVSLVTTGEKYAWNSKYDLPSGGVPKTDLAQGVQDSLGAADSALQAADIAEGSTNGTISVNNTDVPVHGLGTAAYKEDTYFQVAGSYKTTQTAVEDPTASGNSLTFIATLTQNANGEVAVTKKTVQVASTSDIDEIFA